MRPANILHLGIKELRSLLRDPIMVVLIVYAFSVSIYSAATAMPETLHKAPIAIVDEDRSQLSQRIIDAFYPPYFKPPVLITQKEMDARMDAGLDTFALDIPPDFQRDVLAGRIACHPAQHRRHPDEPGLHRQRLYPDHHQQRGERLSPGIPVERDTHRWTWPCGCASTRS